MTKEKKMSKGQIQQMINNKKPATVGMNQDTINQVAAAAERTRVGILESVTAEITALEEALKGAVDAGAPEIPAAFLTAIAAVKANATQKAWLGFFGVYHQYGIVPRAAGPEPEAKPEVGVKIELDVPKGPDSPDADKFAKEAADKIAEEIEEKQATDDLAAAREKLVKERGEKH